MTIVEWQDGDGDKCWFTTGEDAKEYSNEQVYVVIEVGGSDSARTTEEREVSCVYLDDIDVVSQLYNALGRLLEEPKVIAVLKRFEGEEEQQITVSIPWKDAEQAYIIGDWGNAAENDIERRRMGAMDVVLNRYPSYDLVQLRGCGSADSVHQSE